MRNNINNTLLYVSSIDDLLELLLSLSVEWSTPATNLADARKIILRDKRTLGYVNHHWRYKAHMRYLQPVIIQLCYCNCIPVS